MGSEGYLINQSLRPEPIREPTIGVAIMTIGFDWPSKWFEQRAPLWDPSSSLSTASACWTWSMGVALARNRRLGPTSPQALPSSIRALAGTKRAYRPLPHGSARCFYLGHSTLNGRGNPVGDVQSYQHARRSRASIGGRQRMIPMARPFLADPIMLKGQEARTDEINTCIACNQACLDHIFKNQRCSCLVNPLACHEAEWSIEPTQETKKLAVVVPDQRVWRGHGCRTRTPSPYSTLPPKSAGNPIWPKPFL